MATYRKGDSVISIGNDLCHKTKGLYIGNQYVIQRVATFHADGDAEAFERFFCEFCGVMDGKDEA
jgi:hypothetical protein